MATDRGLVVGRVASTRGFLPTDVPEAVSWFSARSGVTNVSGAASQWDSVIGSFSATQATAGKRPTIATGINGKDTLHFTSASSQELVNTTTNITTTNATRYLLIVAIAATSGGGNLFTFRSSEVGGRCWSCGAATAGGNRNYMTDATTDSVSAVLATEPSILSPFIIEYEITLNATPVIRINGGSRRPLSGTINAAGEAGPTGFRIGNLTPLASSFWDGDVADIYCAVGIPSEANKAKLLHYFAGINGMSL